MKKRNSIVRVLALMLCAVMLLGCLTSCGDEDEKGSFISIYLGAEVRNWDPAIGFTDSAAVSYFSLVYDGLMTHKDNGKLEKLGCDEIETKTNSAGELIMTIRITGNWSDGRPVSANDYIYSWKRILNPDFTSPAKELLYPIKNARAIVNGEKSIDDLCLYAPKTQLLQVVFEDPEYNTDLFLENLTSMALVPVREDMAEVYDGWDHTAIDIMSNGPFNVKKMETNEEGGELVLERNKYYTEVSHNPFLSEEVKYKYVTPYRLVITYGNATEIADGNAKGDTVKYTYADREAAYNFSYKDGEIKTEDGVTFSEASDEIFYLCGITGQSEIKHVKTEDLMSTYCYYFNTNEKPFNNADVRKALSMAIDRNAIAALYAGANGATGLVPNGVTYSKNGDSFRKKSGDLISVEGDIDGAKALLKSAGVSSGSFTLTYRDVNRNGEIAEMVKAVWEELGFKVKLEGLDFNEYTDKMTLVITSELYANTVMNDEKKLVTHYYRLDLNGKKTEITKEEYESKDNKGLLTSEDAVDKDGVTQATQYYQFDENGEKTQIEETVYRQQKYEKKDSSEKPDVSYTYDVIGLDFQALTANAFSSLSLFAPAYSGVGKMSRYSYFDDQTHMTGWSNDDFNQLMDQAYATYDRKEQSDFLIQAEKILMDEMPVCPIIFNATSYVKSSKLSKIDTTNQFGCVNFTKAKLKKFHNYDPESEKESLAENSEETTTKG